MRDWNERRKQPSAPRVGSTSQYAPRSGMNLAAIRTLGHAFKLSSVRQPAKLYDGGARMRASDTFDANIQLAGPDWPAVVVASAFKTGVLVARSLTKRGVRVVLVDCNPQVEGFRSIYGTTELCPNPDTAPDEWFSFMQALSQKLGGRPALLAASDQFISAIGQYADPLADFYRLSPSATLQAKLADKVGQVRLALANGLPAPRTLIAINEAAVAHYATETPFPVLIKPRQHRLWSAAPAGHPLHQIKAVKACDAAELMAFYRLAAALSPGVILQEMIPGPETDKRVHIAIYRRDGERLAHLTLKELRGTRFGAPTVCEPIVDEEVAAVCDRFFQAIGYRGTCEIELIWDRRDQLPKMMDINPRFSGTGDAAMYAGIDQPWLTYLDLIEQPVQPVAPPTRHFRHIMLENDCLAIRQNLEAGTLTWRALRETYRGPLHFWDFELRDWRLAGSTALTIVRASIAIVCALVRQRLGGDPPR